MRAALACCLLLLAPAPAGAEEWALLRGQQVVSISFEGAPGLEGELLGRITVQAGDRLNPQNVRRSMKLLYHLGLFGQVQALARTVPDGVELIFRCSPRRRVLKVEVLGNDSLEEAGRLSRLRRGDELDHFQMQASADDMLRLYQSRGFRRARVLFRAEGPEGGDVVVRYFIQEGPPTRISRLWIRGRPVFPQGRLEKELGLKKGERLDLERLEPGLERLRQFYRRQGYFELRLEPKPVDIELKADLEVLVLDIQAGPPYTFDFSGQQRMRRRTLQKALDKILGEIPLRATPDLDEISRRLEEFYRRQGYARAQVGFQVSSARDGKQVVFLIEEGPRVVVRQIDFVGATAFGQEVLRAYVEQALLEELPQPLVGQPLDRGDLDVLGGQPQETGRRADRPQGFLRELVPERMFLAGPYHRALDQIADLYQTSGYLEVSIGEPVLSYDPEGARLMVDIPLQEGPRTQVESVSFEGNHVFDSARLLEIAEQKDEEVSPGRPLNLSAVENLRRKLLKAYQAEGYLFCQVEQRLRFSQDRELAEVSFVMDEGPQVHVGHVLVRGYVDTDPEVFEHLVRLRRSEVFSPQKADKIRRDLDRLGVFSGVEVKLMDPETAAQEKDVLVEARERLARSLVVSPGISTAEGVRLQLDYSHRNLGGYALELVGRAKASYLAFYPLYAQWEERYQEMSFFEGLEGYALVGLHLPRVWWWERDVAARLDLVALQDHAISHDLTKFSLTPGLDWTLWEKLSLSSELELEFDRLGCIGAECGGPTQKYLRYDEGSLLLGGLRPQLALDLRDNIFNPRRGGLATLRSELAGNMLPDREVFYLKIEALATGYLPLGRAATLALSLQGGFIFNLLSGSKTPSHKLFWLGGRNSVRGFAEEALIPADQRNPDDPTTPCVTTPESGEQRCVSLGGNAMLLAKAELRFPLIPNVLDGALFVDFGNLWMRLEDVRPWDLRPATGFGVRLITPVGPVALDLGINLNPDSARREETWNLHFNIGIF